MKNWSNKKSFTLAELSVVVIIMIVLGTLAMVTLAPARAKTRDVRRRADLDTMYKALEWYWADARQYPVWTSGCLEKTDASGYPPAFSDPAAKFLGTWIERMPKDPLYGKGYCYYYKTDANGTNYHLIAKMEKDTEKKAENDGGLFPGYYEIFSAGGSELELINTSSTEVTAAMGQ